MTSNSTFPRRLTKIDDLTRPDHSYLTGEDTCYFLGEYTARRGFAFSVTNDVILNFKKSVSRRGRAEWQYKDWAIRYAAAAFRAAIDDRALDSLTFVPVPPSKTKDDPLYDDRLVQLLQAIRPDSPLDVRELVMQIRSTEAAHDSAMRPTPETLAELYQVDRSLFVSAPTEIAIVDDVLTTGAHFRAVKLVLERELPGTRIIGLFIARRAPDTMDIEDLERP